MSLIDYRTKYSDVFALYDKGLSFQAIATSLGTTKGRVAGIVLRYKQKLEATS